MTECVQWFIQNKLKEAGSGEWRAAQTRKLTLEADRIELELQEKKKELIAIETVNAIWSQILSSVKSKMLLIPKKLETIFDSLNDSYDLEHNSEEMIYEALEELSRAADLVEKQLEGK